MIIAFRKTKEPHGWMGNMAPYPVTHEGLEWKTTEALFQALRFDDPAIKEEIRSQKSPMAAKMVAKKNADKMIIRPMDVVDCANMIMCVKLKLEQHPELKTKLLETGDQTIYEDIGARVGGNHSFWGASLQADGTWAGQNYMGYVWMRLRSELKETASKEFSDAIVKHENTQIAWDYFKETNVCCKTSK